MKDSHGRNIDYLRVSVTDRCNLRCIYCMPEEGIKKQEHKDILRFEEIVKVVRAAVTLGVKKVRYTGGEPLILRGIDKLIYETSRLRTIEDIALTTNGVLLSQMAGELKKAGLKRVNISLDTLDRDKFERITRMGDLNTVLDGIHKCISIGLNPVKINTVLMRGINHTEVNDFINLTRELPVEIRFIELMPIGEGEKLFEERKISLKEVINEHKELNPLAVKPGSTAELYAVKGAKGKIGFISPMSCKFCSNCNRIRLTAAGTIKPCLHSKEELSIVPYLQNEDILTEVIKNAIFNKPAEHHLEEENKSRSMKMMYQIGG
jgi:cyclic pyranopterin phosphate synthase